MYTGTPHCSLFTIVNYLSNTMLQHNINLSSLVGLLGSGVLFELNCHYTYSHIAMCIESKQTSRTKNGIFNRASTEASEIKTRIIPTTVAKILYYTYSGTGVGIMCVSALLHLVDSLTKSTQ